MCLFRSRTPTALPTPQPIQPRNPDLVDPDDVAGVEYGTTQRKDDTRGAAKRTGTDALKININTGGDAGGGTGGLNV
jgi:hypothetical protein